MILIKNNATDPTFNLAAEEYLLDHFKQEIFMLWRNRPAVIVGKNQNTLSEIDLQFVKAYDVCVVRRLTGGGAVFHDLGNINYTYIEPENGGHFSDYSYFTADLIDFLNTIGVNAQLSGRNDILLDGAKICGNAQCVRNHMVMHHGCILYSADLSRLSGALKAKQEKFAGKGIKSVASRVTNIADHMEQKKEAAWFLDAFQYYIANKYACTEYDFSAHDIAQIKTLAQEKYATWAWNFGRSPDYNFINIKKFDFGLVEARFFISGGIIKSANISGDFFGKLDISDLEVALVGKPHSIEGIESVIEAFDIGSYITGCSREELIAVLL